MRVILLRHAQAESRDPERWPDDAERPLTSRGNRRAKRSAAGVFALEPTLTRVFSSPAIRATSTAAPLVEVVGEEARLEPLELLSPEAHWREMLTGLAALAEEDATTTLAFVGHEPGLGKLAGALLFGAPTPMPLKKGGACSIEVDSPAAGSGVLCWWCPPRALRAIARKRRSS